MLGEDVGMVRGSLVKRVGIRIHLNILKLIATAIETIFPFHRPLGFDSLEAQLRTLPMSDHTSRASPPQHPI